METERITTEQAEKNSPEELFKALSSSPEGLTSQEAIKRLALYGPNALEDKKVNPILQFLRYFWGPIPWMIEVAAILSLVVKDWTDFTIIMVLLVFNSVIGFWEEHRAANALDALKSQLALKARALRDGKWAEAPAGDLVPGDVLRIRLGDIIPADVKLVEGDYLSVDQSALTGESLPVDKKQGEIAYSGSVAKQGEMVALVTNTGSDTFFGRTASLVASAGAQSHFQKAVMKVGDFLIFIAVGLSIILVVTELMRGAPVIDLIQFVLILVVASIPVAMPAVLSVTMALGALALSKMKAIVSRLQSIEELAGVDILCSDKTGTLTLNKLTLGDPVTFEAKDADDLILAASLASKAEDQDAMDLAVLAGLKDPGILNTYKQLKFIPFDPVNKRTEATVEGKDGKGFKVTKGAPQVIMELSRLDAEEKNKAEGIVDEFASKGYRTLGVAQEEVEGNWRFLGILPLYDPPREDSKETLAQAQAHGIKVKMITGDNVAIARETAGKLGLGKGIQAAEQLFKSGVDAAHLSHEAAKKVEEADGFAQVFPEHKFGIVKVLQEQGHLVAMTGDGVNDAPPLKQADAGIAVSGATDAARAAADLVLTAPGLSVIIKAVEEARRIFERMMSYTIYRIAMTIDIMFFVVLAMLAFNFQPLTAVMIILLALLDDIPIMTIAYDNTWLDPNPVRWDMHRVLSISSVLGFLAVLETFGLLIIGDRIMHLDIPHLQSAVFLQLVAGGHLMLFLTRTKKAFWMPPHPSWPLFLSIVGTQILAILLCGFGWLVPQLPWHLIGLVWAYNLVWMILQDVIKLGVYRLAGDRAHHKQKYLKMVNQPLHPHGG